MKRIVPFLMIVVVSVGLGAQGTEQRVTPAEVKWPAPAAARRDGNIWLFWVSGLGVI